MQKIELQTYPQKKTIGKLNAQVLRPWYEAKFEILDTRNTSNEWLLGEIKENFAWCIDQYTITLAERTILLQSKVGSRTFKFYNETKNYLHQIMTGEQKRDVVLLVNNIFS
ncbi:unnamed protein product [Adineta steineri]|uniref:Uncharacterized protein n=1 Tax=Adineta steineri TaxID=433720 RepID=A0A813XF24_9BILA|nr:unnamed protein product [Adineta steineri]